MNRNEFQIKNYEDKLGRYESGLWSRHLRWVGNKEGQQVRGYAGGGDYNGIGRMDRKQTK